MIDAQAFEGLLEQLKALKWVSKWPASQSQCAGAAINSIAVLFRPVMLEVAGVAAVKAEIFGPVLQVVRLCNAALPTPEAVVAHRNMIGAVVGVQPFGGEALIGTGPKAGAPNYLVRFCVEQTVSINTAAAGGNVQLLA